MIYKFSDASKNVLENAEKVAIELGHNFIGTEHILYGISKEKTGLGFTALEKQNIYSEQIYMELKENLGQGKIILTKTDGFTPRSKKIIEESFKITEKNALPNIGTEILLLSIIKDKENLAYKILISLNANINRIEEDILKMIQDIEELSKSRKVKKTSSNNILNQYGTDLNKLAEEEKINSVIGREKEIERLIQILSRKNKNNPCLIGEPGVGKTAIVEGLAKRIVNKDVPEILRGKTIYNLDLTSIIAGAKYRGDFEERIKKCLNEVKESTNIILFIDEIHTIVGAGAAEGAIDAANILKPILARGEIQLIGATTIDEYTKYIEKDAALERRFCPINVEEPSLEETINILKGLKEVYQKHHNVLISNDVIKECVYLSNRYITNRFMPDKAIDILDEAASRTKIKNTAIPEEIKLKEKKVEELEKEKNIEIEKQNFESAAKIRDEEIKRKYELSKMKEKWNNNNTIKKIEIETEDIKNVISDLTNIPLRKISEEENIKLKNLKAEIHKTIIGQDKAIDKVSKAIIRGRIGINDPNKPVGSFIFLGPTGVGKTELAKALANSIFGNEKFIIKLDMSEYMEAFSVSKIIGAPPGYVGYDKQTALTKKIRQNPYSIIVFDEIEKAHPDILNILLQILDEGNLTDSSGRNINFRNTIIIITSNIGDNVLSKNVKIGFGEDSEIEEDKKVMKELKKTLKPELINRIDDIIIFNKLSAKELIDILDLEIKKINKRIENKNINIEISQEVKQFIVKNKVDYNYGARDLKRVLQKIVEDEIAKVIISGELNMGGEIVFIIENGKIEAKIYQKVL